MNEGQTSESSWFRALLDHSADVYFRYSLLPARRFVYLSPSVHALAGHTPEAFYKDAALCLSLIPREDRRLLRQVLRSRRGLTLTIRLIRAGETVPLELCTVAVIRHRRVVAVEGVVRLAAPAVVPDSEPAQQKLAALMYQVHDLLHRVLPAASAASTVPARQLRLGDLAFDPERLTAMEADKEVPLTSRETMVLRYLLQHSARIVTRQQLLTDVWGYRYTGDDRTVDVHISRLRRKLPSLRARLVAVKHVGYRIDDSGAGKAGSAGEPGGAGKTDTAGGAGEARGAGGAGKAGREGRLRSRAG